MNDEFYTRALQKVEPPQEHLDTARPRKERKQIPERAMDMVLGYSAVNRRDRRKAAKLLRSEGA